MKIDIVVRVKKAGVLEIATSMANAPISRVNVSRTLNNSGKYNENGTNKKVCSNRSIWSFLPVFDGTESSGNLSPARNRWDRRLNKPFSVR